MNVVLITSGLIMASINNITIKYFVNNEELGKKSVSAPA